jgi:predicted aspartyl protease
MQNIKQDRMGEVHVQVRLANAVDVILMEKGLLEPDKVRRCEVDAIVDTGATRSVLSLQIAATLGLGARRKAFATLADGKRVGVDVSGPVSFEIEGREVLEDAYILGDTVLVGQTVLELSDLLVDCTNRKVIPNPAHPDGPVLRI